MHSAIARNYADALLALATKENARDTYGALISALADVLERDETFKRFLEAPQVSHSKKNDVLGKALADKAPALFVRFVQKLVTNGRQMLLGDVANEYNNLRDAEEGRVHARVTVSREMSDADRDALVASLSKALGKQVVPHLHVNPAILGGVVVRVGDTVMDGSVRRRLSALRSRMSR
ncbi:MAG: F0F1 ATP synthase subunit delta [Gemmatimonadaceae bacterium]|nr:F0F1 ATP synthase subunit delta [Gemmatimonadaceae bacterium]